MKRFLVLCCLLIVQVAHAQIEPLDFAIYRGNYGERQLLLPLADSAKTVTATAFYSRNGNPLPSVSQPVIIRSASPGTQVIVRFERTDILPDVGWVDVYVSGQIRASGRLIVGKNAQGLPGTSPVVTNPTSPTITTPISVPIIRVVQLDNVGTGYVVVHNQNTILLTADMFWTGTMQRDYCWTYEADSPNSGHLVGPPTERFFGQMILTFYKNVLPVSTN